MVIVDVWGGPGAPPNAWQARHVRPLDEALRWVERELLAGHLVNACALPDGHPQSEFDARVAGHG